MSKHFGAWKIDEAHLLLASVQDYVPQWHLSRLIVSSVRERLDPSEITASYRSSRGQPAFDPRMMTALLLHGSASGLFSLRRLAKASIERADFMMIVADDPPDFRTISDFRRRHLRALSGLFVQVLQLAERAGPVKLGHVALGGTKIKAKAALETEAKAAAAEVMQARAEAEGQRKARGRKKTGKAAKPPGEGPAAKTQRDFTDPESRILKTKDGFIQGYDAQAAVDARAQVIVAHGLTSSMSDHGQLVPLVDDIEAGLQCRLQEVSADSGYPSEASLQALKGRDIRAYIATRRAKRPDQAKHNGGPLTQDMRRRHRQAGRRSRYRRRKQVVEPLFGQIKQARGFRQFLLPGIEKVSHEWALVCTGHNLAKLSTAKMKHRIYRNPTAMPSIWTGS